MAELCPGEYLSVCRLCLSDRTEALKSIFDVALGPNRLPYKVQQLVAIQVHKQDKFSTLICNDCIIRLDTFHAYKRECHRNQTKLAEWLNKSTGGGQQTSSCYIKPDPDEYENNEVGMVNGHADSYPVKVELTESMDEEYNDLPPHLTPQSFDQDMYSPESDDNRRCPECCRMFGSSTNMKRHYHMVHKRNKRSPMNEIKRNLSSSMDSTTHDTSKDQIDSVFTEGGDNEAVSVSDQKMEDVDQISEEQRDANEDELNEADSTRDATPETKPNGNDEHLDVPETDPQKIQFAAGLKLVQRDATPLEFQALSKIELSYLEKCKAMVSMFQTLQCACHNVQHKTLRNLLSHLRELRIWFPLFTCYSCMISFTDRSTFTKHYTKCPKANLETLMKLSSLKKRSEVKARLYQNYKCNRCRFLYSFYDDYCKHIDEEHAVGNTTFYCSCRQVFDNVEDYKMHCYNSCILAYYCDICFITTTTIEDFVKHCQETHDNSEGFVLLQEDGYSPRKASFSQKEAEDEPAVVEGKRERRKPVKAAPVPAYDDTPFDAKDIPARVLVKKILNIENLTAAEWRNPASCPACHRDYSSLHNMIRHYRTHLERKEVTWPKDEPTQNDADDDDDSLYTCPDCGGMYSSTTWPQHLEEYHPLKSCDECDKMFQFQTELDEHQRSKHRKPYRNTKSDTYNAQMSPERDSNGLLTVHGEVMVMCEICDTMFKTKEDLRSHKLMYHNQNSSQPGSSFGDNEPDADFDIDNDVTDGVMPVLATVEEDEKDEVLSEGADKYPCDICGRIYSSLKTLKEHLKNKHGTTYVKTEYPKKCDYCDKVCATGAGLYLHTQMHERMTLSDLREDDSSSQSSILKARKKLMEEPVETEEESYHSCKQCFKIFATRSKLKEHLKTHGINTVRRPKKYLCDICHTSFDSSDDLGQHKAEDHADELEGMPELVSEMEVEPEDIKDVKPKIKSSAVYCKHCRIPFDSVEELSEHMKDEHNEPPKTRIVKRREPVEKGVKCPICKKGFASVGAMTAHFGWHKRSGSRLQTPIANTPQALASFKLARQTKILKKTVPPPRPQVAPAPKFQCSTCYASLPNDTALQIHILEKHRNMEDVMLVPRCTICNKDFATQQEYDTHKRFHDFLERQKKQGGGTPQFLQKRSTCTWCPSSFSRTDTLQAHVRQHHPQHARTEFRCPQCDRTFEKQNSLTIHLKMHEKQRNLAASSSSSSMGASPSGSSGKVYLCPICNMTFHQTKDLRTHTINAHPF